MYSMLTIVNTTVLFIRKLLKVDLKNYHKKKDVSLCMVMVVKKLVVWIKVEVRENEHAVKHCKSLEALALENMFILQIKLP